MSDTLAIVILLSNMIFVWLGTYWWRQAIDARHIIDAMVSAKVKELFARHNYEEGNSNFDASGHGHIWTSNDD